jgi:hypothetical protein
MEVVWVPAGERPGDWEDWERVIQERAEQALGTGVVRLRKLPDGWLIEEARIGGSAFGVGSLPPTIPPALDFRHHLSEALKAAGKPVIQDDRRTEGSVSAEPPALQELRRLLANAPTFVPPTRDEQFQAWRRLCGGPTSTEEDWEAWLDATKEARMRLALGDEDET